MYTAYMPIRNTTKEFDAPAYYHVYNRGAGNQQIYVDDADRVKFLSLIERHLDPSAILRRSDGVEYEKYDIQLVAYCLMGNHFHLLVFQPVDPTAITQLMRSIATAYTMYFNRKYKRSGHLFQSNYKASRIDNESYLLHISRYIHMNPRRYLRYKWSSIRFYLGQPAPDWVRPELINSMSAEQYRDFLEQYEGRKAEIDALKSQLAL